MASLVYNNAMLITWQGTLDLREAGDDIRIALLMTNTTADTEEETALMNAFTTLDEMDGAGYARKTCDNQAVAIDTTNDRVEFDHDDVTWSALGNGTRAVQGALYYKHVTNDTDSIPLQFTDFAADQNPGGSDFTLQVNAEGAFQLAQGA